MGYLWQFATRQTTKLLMQDFLRCDSDKVLVLH